MNNVMAMTGLAASLLVSTAAIAAPANLADALQPTTRFFPSDTFFYGGDYADYGYYGGDCGWLARLARATGSGGAATTSVSIKAWIWSRPVAGPFPSALAADAVRRRR